MGLAHAFRVVIFPEIQGTRAMAFVVGFIYDIETELIAQLVEPGSVRIVAGSDGIEIVGFDHVQIPAGLFDTAYCAGLRV